ncbi:hypothetical protein ACG873_03135 [Mesorhizobium sp. AaZ16]
MAFSAALPLGAPNNLAPFSAPGSSLNVSSMMFWPGELNAEALGIDA